MEVAPCLPTDARTVSPTNSLFHHSRMGLSAAACFYGRDLIDAVQEFDGNEDGEIKVEEFVEFWRTQCEVSFTLPPDYRCLHTGVLMLGS